MMWVLYIFALIGVVFGQTNNCHHSCTSHFVPVCGSDGRTYVNRCQLNNAICYAKLRGTILRLSHTGRCDHHVTHSPPHSQFSCGDLCDEELNLVCGTDGNTYHNLCFLKQASCEASKTGHFVRTSHYGECTQHETNCPRICDNLQLEPVCSTGNVTFRSACLLQYYGCRYANNQAISERYHFAHNGSCDGVDQHGDMEEIDCNEYMIKSAIAVEGSTGHSWNCTREHEYLCGADHHTYSGPCHCCRSMEAKKQLGLVRAQTNQCHTVCSAVYRPVCGTDGRTYSNQCRLNTAICYAKLKGSRLSLAHMGTCSGSGFTKPPVNIHTPQCGEICDEELGFICGTDAQTYRNKCLLTQANCEAAKTGSHVGIAHYGECTDKDQNCPQRCDNHIDPVCSTGNYTFKNSCWLTLYGCKYAYSQSISDRYHLAHNGSCDGTDPFATTSTVDCSSYITNSGSIAIEGGSTGRISHCPREHEYLCGPDHRTYPGPCNLCRSMDRLSKLDEKNQVHIISESACKTLIG